ncbi:hypothetical protein J3R82DRAFT_10365 [Butyriboletus roseoflavus]|nr:hypothetical protein J3R82DRAFT_10365 [Butyriboletus roseoflavus]
MTKNSPGPSRSFKGHAEQPVKAVNPPCRRGKLKTNTRHISRTSARGYTSRVIRACQARIERIGAIGDVLHGLEM